ncbi:MAG: ankyrin repeat domain-containing protein, partial [Candidatus Dependentiae bacterium]|nr:ankyrin repeat domain-containing protein [Candidatus Dependentiae bacterium]
NSKTIDDLNRAIDSIFLLSRINNLKKLRDQKIDYVVKYSGVNLKINHSFLKDQIQEWIRDQILNYGFSLLDWAIATKKVEKVKLFLDAGANIDRQDDYGYTALMMAVANNNPEIVELLLAAHPNINLQNKSGDTALHLAKSASIERMLLDAGANLDIRNKKDQTPTIKFDNKPNLASSASEYKPNKGDNTTLMGIAVAENRSEMVEPLLADHPNVNLQDKSGNTALHYAKNLSIANMLLNADADRNIRNNDDQTAAERINLVGKQGALSRHISQYKPKK